MSLRCEVPSLAPLSCNRDNLSPTLLRERGVGVFAGILCICLVPPTLSHLGQTPVGRTVINHMQGVSVLGVWKNTCIKKMKLQSCTEE